MLRRALLLAASLALTTALPMGTAAPGCAPVDAAAPLQPLPELAGLPQGWRPYLALDESRLPPIPSVVAEGPLGRCDLTADLPAFAAMAGVTDPAQRAALVVASTFPDQLGVPKPLAMEVEGDLARVVAASAEKGLVLAWVVDVAAMRGEWVVTETGPGQGDFEGWHPWVGFSSQTLRDLENGALVTKTLMVPNPDGSAFRLTYFTQFYSSEAQADAYAAAYAAASRAIWDVQVAQWGFASADPDRVYDIKMDGCSCISGGNNVNIRVHAKLEDLYNFFSPPLIYPSNAHFYRIVIGHEFHHHLQYSINQWQGGGAMVEGGARFSETVYEPVGAYGTNTLTSVNNINGFSNVMSRPYTDLGGRLYDFGLFWGYLHGADGGIQTIKKVYEEASGSFANEAIPAAVTAALAEVPGAQHRSFEEAYEGLAVAMAKRDVSWGLADNSSPRNWAAILAPLTKSTFTDTSPVLSQSQGTVAYRTLSFASVSKGGPLVASWVGDGAVGANWVVRTSAGFTVSPADTAALLNEPGQGEVILAMAGGPTSPMPDPGRQIAGAHSYRANVLHG